MNKLVLALMKVSETKLLTFKKEHYKIIEEQ